MRIAEIWQYPVKSMVGTTVAEAEVGPLGIVADRTWAARDLERGGIRGAKHIGGLMQMTARFTAEPGGHVTITLPDGTEVASDAPDRDERLSAALGREVRLESLAPVDDLDHYRRGEPYHDDLMTELRSIFGRDSDAELPDLSGMPEEIFTYESPLGTHHDAFPLLLVSSSALAALAEALPDSNVDVRRFRPSIVIDTPEETGHPEVGWVGQRIQVGEVELRATIACPRCVMVTREIDAAITQDRRVLRHIVDELDHAVGVYAEVVRPGRIRPGDPVTLLG